MSYIFSGEEYNSLSDLALAYSKDFELAIEDVYTNTKKLVKFIRKSNKTILKEAVSYISKSLYKNNAVTFLIFLFLDEKKVFINNKEYSFKEFMLALIAFKDTKDNMFECFVRDKGLSKTYAKLDVDKKIKEDAFYIEENFDNHFTKLYLDSYFGYEMTNFYYGKLTSVAISGEECYREASKICNSDDFLIYIAHKYGFKQACLLKDEKNALFDSCKLLKNFIDNDMLIKLVYGSFYWWLCDNFDKYDFKKEAVFLHDRLQNIKNEHEDAINKLDKKNNEKLDFDYIVETSKLLYLYYFEFVKLYKYNFITVKEQEDKAKFDLNKVYCYTMICSDYMTKNIVKLSTKEDTSTDLEEKYKIRPDQITKCVYGYKKSFRLANTVLVTSILMGIIMFVMLTFGKGIFDKINKDFTNVDNLVNSLSLLIFFVASLGLANLFASILYNIAIKSQKSMKCYLLLKRTDYRTLIIGDEDEFYLKNKENIDGLEKSALKTGRIISSLVFGFTSIIYVIFLCLVNNTLTSFVSSYNKVFDATVFNSLIVCSGAFLLGFGYGMLRKYKGFIDYLVLLVISIAFLMIGIFVL